MFGLWKLGEGVGLGPFLKTFHWMVWVCGCSEGVGCVRGSATVSKGARLDDADGNPVLLVWQRRGGGQLAWRVFWWLPDTDT